jgi:thiosulfate/3-mercaptopyruvate sulfurtransferase
MPRIRGRLLKSRMTDLIYTTLISAELKALQDNGSPLMIFDCSFDLMNPAAGEQYRKAHIPGAAYANVDAT